MQNTVRTNVFTELTIAKHRLAEVIQDPVILEDHHTLAESCLKALTSLDKQIMTFKVSPKSSRNKVHVKNKHKQTGS